MRAIGRAGLGLVAAVLMLSATVTGPTLTAGEPPGVEQTAPVSAEVQAPGVYSHESLDPHCGVQAEVDHLATLAVAREVHRSDGLWLTRH